MLKAVLFVNDKISVVGGALSECHYTPPQKKHRHIFTKMLNIGLQKSATFHGLQSNN